MSALSELLNDANGARLSARSLARNAQQAGFSLNHDTAARYLRGDHGRPDESTLLALSKVLRLPMSKLRTAAALPAEETEPYRPPAEASRLNRRQRRALDEMIRAMLDGRPSAEPGPIDDLAQRRTRHASVSTKPTKKPAVPKAGDGSRAARRGAAERT
jgi:transcriptional regulator with XRE-family HTH domain